MGTAILTEAQKRRNDLEEDIDDARTTVARQCYRIGKAMHTIRTDSLWSDDYKSFDEYCVELWDFNPELVRNWITASQIGETLTEVGLAINQLTISNALALSKTDDPVQVWSEVSAASPSPTAEEIEKVAALHLPLLSGDGLTKDEERVENETAEKEIERAVAHGRLLGTFRRKLRNLRKLYEPAFAAIRPKVARMIEMIDEVLAELGD